MTISKIILIIFITITFNNSFGQSKDYTINGKKFTFKTQQPDDENEILELYRGKQKILSHTLLKEEGDCSSTSIQLGNYSIIDDTIVFYSYWAVSDRMPKSLLPFGFRKQEYLVKSNGAVNLKKSIIYIEDFVENEDRSLFEDKGWKHKGIKYLNQSPKTKQGKLYLVDYIKSIEKEYNSKFVFGKRKKTLENEVRIKLRKQIKQHTGKWDDKKTYGKSKK